MTRRIVAAISLAVLSMTLLLLSGCQRMPLAGAWHLALTTTPATPVSMTETQFVLHVAGPDGAPITGATASMDIVMRSMDMGANHVALADHGHGDYAGQGQFPMAGTWECRVTVSTTGRNGRSQLQVFPVTVE